MRTLGAFATLATLLSLVLLSVGSPAICKRQANKAAVSKHVTEADALRIVAQRKEVIEWKKNVTTAAAKTRGVTAHITLDRKEGDELIVHVYEVVPDDSKTSHTATMNWYHVNAKTGKVTKEF